MVGISQGHTEIRGTEKRAHDDALVFAVSENSGRQKPKHGRGDEVQTARDSCDSDENEGAFG
jgi:hypothetical protein